jgi:multidrug transporter EmrE-like cation transporter
VTVLNLNPIAIVAALIVHQALGFLWYGPLFGKTWMAARGVTPETIGDWKTPMMVSTVVSLVMTIAMAMLISAASVQNVIAGITLALVVSIGIVATTQIQNVVYEDRNRTVTGLFIGYQVVALIVMAIILGAWR